MMMRASEFIDTQTDKQTTLVANKCSSEAIRLSKAVISGHHRANVQACTHHAQPRQARA